MMKHILTASVDRPLQRRHLAQALRTDDHRESSGLEGRTPHTVVPGEVVP